VLEVALDLLVEGREGFAQRGDGVLRQDLRQVGQVMPGL
jgi:hypothetical protein